MNIRALLDQSSLADPAFSPVPLWWWSGEKLEINRLKWQLDQLSGMGIHNVCIINLAPNGTLFGSDADDPPFLSEEWWEIFEAVCDHAQAIGTLVWFYDQIGFSGASYQAEIAAAHPECVAEQLRRVTAEGTGTLRVECPGAGTPLAAYVVPIGGDAPPIYISLDGRAAAFDANVPSRLSMVFTLRTGYDLFARSACERLLDAVHRQFERRVPRHIGTTIVGSFQDELPDLPTWGHTFAETFAAKFGYRLEDVIHLLFEPGDADARRTRVHYHAHRADLAEAAFFKPFFQWHEQRKLRCGFDQQSPAREARVIGCVSKYADYIQTHRWYAIPGSDLHGNGKLHASVAFMYDRPRVWLEGFHSTGWGGTIADTFDWLLPYLQSGANLYNPHAVYYSTRMGWWEWAPPSTCWRQPYARHYRPFAEMIARLTKVLSHGIQQATVGVIFPSATVQSAMGPQEHFAQADAADHTLHELMGSMRWHQAKRGVLDSIPIDYLLLDEPTIQRGEVSRGTLTIRQSPIRTIILPSVTFLDDATVDRLTDFAESGGKIITVGSAEVETPGGMRVQIESLPNALAVASSQDVARFLQDGPRLIHAPVPTLYKRDGDVHVLFVPAAAGMATVVKWPGWFEPMEHTTIVPERYLATAEITVPGEAKTIWQLDPWGGKARALSTKESPDGRTFTVDFDGAPCATLVWSELDLVGQTGISAPPISSALHKIPLALTWTCEYIPTLPEDYADTHDPSRPELRWPHTTDFKWICAEGDADWSRGIPDSVPTETVRATFGVRAWRSGTSGTGVPPVSSSTQLICGQDGHSTAITYSPHFGILQDKLHINTLGPKSHVPEEFIDLGKPAAGQTVTIRTGIISDHDRRAFLAIGANAINSARVNGKDLTASSNGYLWMADTQLIHGENEIDIKLTADRDGTVRLFWCLLHPQHIDRFRRPERIAPPAPAVPGSSLRFRRKLELSERIVAGEIKVSIAAMASVFVDDRFLGRQGGFDPYRPMMRGQTYAIPALPAGSHEIRIEVVEPNSIAPLLADLRARTASGQEIHLMTDSNWTVQRDAAAPQPAVTHLRPEADAAAWHLYRRPHPLPGASWLAPQNSSPAVVLDLPLRPPLHQPATQFFQWIIPPGAIGMHLPMSSVTNAQLWIDGDPLPIATDGNVALFSASTIAPPASRTAVLRVASRQLAGGVFTGFVSYHLGTGTLATGSWLTQGLRSYSGAIRMTQTFHLSTTTGATATLDLGHVRGTAQVTLNGQAAGIRCMSPYRFDLAGLLAAGSNELEIIITNTLANHLSTWSPSTWWSPDQLESGVFGPVIISIGEK